MFPCSSCGAALHFAPGTRHLRCPYCGTENEIAPATSAGEEPAPLAAQPYDDFAAAHGGAARVQALLASCKSCGASTTLPEGVTASTCPFCAAPLIPEEAQRTDLLQPHGVLPFRIAAADAQARFRAWLRGLWFAPGDLAQAATGVSGAGALQGVYLPFWAYDAHCTSTYSGQRGEHYWVDRVVTVRDSQGRQTPQTQRVQQTRWYPANGTVEYAFKDVLVAASPSLPASFASVLEPWGLEALAAYDARYVSGFRAETFRTDVATALGTARQRMKDAMQARIRAQIGGDVQAIHSSEETYRDVGVKYILLPVWMAAYRYRGKLYRFAVNASTGEVTGDRPWSAVKIALAVILALIVLALVLWLGEK